MDREKDEIKIKFQKKRKFFAYELNKQLGLCAKRKNRIDKLRAAIEH
jgi:hypothetical protein